MVKIANIIKTNNIIKIQEGESLSSTLSKLKTSHDAAFIFSGKKYLGLVNPYYSLIKSSFPGNAKVEHCLFHAPHVKINFSLSKIADLFTQSKVHYLPVFDNNDSFIGIISARRLLASFRNSSLFKVKIKDILRQKKGVLFTAYEDDPISQAINIFKEKKISKLIVLGKDLKLKGILSYFDLVYFLVSPKSSEDRGQRQGYKTSFYNQRIKNFAKSYVITLKENNYLSDAVNMILDKKIGSVVIVDGERHPIGILTTKDMLRLLIKNGNEKKIEIISKNLSKESRQVLGGFFNYLTVTLGKIPNINKIKVSVNEKKETCLPAGRKNNLFEVILSLIPIRGKPQVIKKEGHDLPTILKKIKKD